MKYNQTQFLDNILEIEAIPCERLSTLNKVMELLQFVSNYDTIQISIEELKSIPIEALKETWNIVYKASDRYSSRNADELVQQMNKVELVKDNLISIKSKFAADEDDFF